MGFSRQEYGSGLPVPLIQENPPDLGIKPASLVSPALAGRFLPGKPYALLGTVRLL